MSEFDFPPDLLQLRKDYDAADARVQQLLDVGGSELEAARAERLDLVGELYAHPWFVDVNQYKAREALKAAAREGDQTGQ